MAGSRSAGLSASPFGRDHLRIHIPILTTPDVILYCGDDEVHMAAGEAWTFDNWQQHRVHNPSVRARIHRVIDTVGSAALWKMLEPGPAEPRRIEYDPAAARLAGSAPMVAFARTGLAAIHRTAVSGDRHLLMGRDESADIE